MPKSDADYKLSPEERTYLRELMRLYRERNRERYNEYHREYYKKNKAKHHACAKAWVAAHPEYKEWKAAYQREWCKKRREKGNDES